MSHKKYAVFTMDVETFADTECISSSGVRVDVDLMDGLEEYLKILDKHGIKGTLFTVGDLAPQIADRLRGYIAAGHRIALHGHSHVAPMSIPLEQFREKTKRAKERLQELFGIEIAGYRAPCFSMDKARLDVLRDLGFAYDSSYLDYLPARHTVKMDLDNYRQLRENIFCQDAFYEFGLSKEKIFGHPFPVSGGGYVRLSNWGFMKTLIQHYIHKNDYYVFYLHPFEMTRQKVPLLKELKSYDKFYLKRGIGTYDRRVEYIIQMLKQEGYEFVTFEQMIRLLDKENA